MIKFSFNIFFNERKRKRERKKRKGEKKRNKTKLFIYIYTYIITYYTVCVEYGINVTLNTIFT